MKEKSFLTRVVGSAFLIVALVLALGVVAFAQDATPLGGTEVSATLQGNAGGAFHHYTVDVPADTEVHIQFWHGGLDPIASAGFGLQAFDPNGFEVGDAVPVEDGAYKELSFRRDDAQRLTLVVFNYSDRAVAYSLKVVGLPTTAEMPMAPAPSQELPATGTDSGAPAADMPADLRTGIDATSQGIAGGAFSRHTISVPADTEIHVQLWRPDLEPLLSAGFGVKGYDENGNEIGTAVPVEDGDYYEFSFRHDDAKMLTLVVYNYTDRAIPYTLKVVGLPMTTAMAPAALPPTGAEAEMEADMDDDDGLAIGGAAWSGVLTGAEGGAFARIPLSYSGDESDVIIMLRFSPSDPSMGDRLGVEVWGPNNNLLGTGTTTDFGGERKVTFASDVAGEYTIVVFNYMEGVTISYSVSATR